MKCPHILTAAALSAALVLTGCRTEPQIESAPPEAEGVSRSLNIEPPAAADQTTAPATSGAAEETTTAAEQPAEG